MKEILKNNIYNIAISLILTAVVIVLYSFADTLQEISDRQVERAKISDKVFKLIEEDNHLLNNCIYNGK